MKRSTQVCIENISISVISGLGLRGTYISLVVRTLRHRRQHAGVNTTHRGSAIILIGHFMFLGMTHKYAFLTSLEAVGVSVCNASHTSPLGVSSNYHDLLISLPSRHATREVELESRGREPR